MGGWRHAARLRLQSRLPRRACLLKVKGVPYLIKFSQVLINFRLIAMNEQGSKLIEIKLFPGLEG